MAAVSLWLSLAAGMAGGAQTSALWGAGGEAWNPTSRLPFFALAGYGSGRRAIPDYPVKANVRDHGAKGDGTTDDTAAFIAALKAVEEGGAVLVPAGRYVITDVIEINRSRIALRGEGSDRSILVIPTPLSEIHPKDNVDTTKAAYSFTGGFVTMKGADRGKKIAAVVAPAKRGDTSLILSEAGGLKAGDWVRLTMRDAGDHSLLRHIHGDVVEPGADTVQNQTRPFDWAARVTAVEGAKITLDRPLRLDVRTEWTPEVLTMEPALAESGIEGLGFEFPGVPKRPHLEEAGYNTIQVNRAVDCWIRDVAAIDADNGIIMGDSRFITVDGFKTRAVKRTGQTGHHALWATGRTQDCLFIGFRFDTTYVHDLTVEGFANGNVFTKGSGVSINCDHHRNGPYENLFTDFDAGDPKRLFASSGRGDRGPHSGARTTFWGIRGQGAFPAMPPAEHWPLINLVGFAKISPSQDPQGPWAEPCGGDVTPANLWEAQVKRLGGK